jgi:hypothetical protein
MQETNPAKLKSLPRTKLLVGLDIAFLILSYVSAVWYMAYQGGGDGFPRNETPAMYHLVGVAIILTVLTSLFIVFGVFCIVTFKRVLKLIPIFGTLLCLLPLLIFVYEIHRWS